MIKTKLPIGTKVLIANPDDGFHDEIGVIAEYADNWDYYVEFQSGHYGHYDDWEVRPRQPQTTKVLIKKLTDTAVTPQYATAGSACFDLVADEDVIVSPGSTIAVSTGLAFELPVGYQMKVLPRSGLSLNTPLRVIIGTVDNDYRLEVKVILRNTAEIITDYSIIYDENGEVSYIDDDERYCDYVRGIDGSVVCYERHLEGSIAIRKGDRIAQAEVVPITQVSFEITDTLSETGRTGGFGSTGTR